MLARGIPDWMHRRFGQRMQRRHGPDWGERLRDEFGNSDPATILRAARACGRFDGKPIYRRMDLPIAMVITTQDTTVATPRQRKLAKLAGAKVFEANTHHTGHMFDVEVYAPALLGALAHVVG